MTTRDPLQIVEIDIERCSLTYGIAPCTAALGVTGDRKCFNCFFACQDQDNFDTVTETLRFSKNQNGVQRSDRINPALQSVSTNPTRINLGGVSDRLGSLGKRARVNVSLKDFRDSDIWFDKYQSERVDGTAQIDEPGYNPADRGTYFTKLHRRFPYYIGRSLRVKEGYVGESLASMRTRHYVITEWDGPNANGNVMITAKDVLDLADNKKAQTPAVSIGQLAEDIADSGLPSFDIEPATVGDDYPASGTAMIGSEIVEFTRSVDTITLTARAVGGSDAAAHSDEDTFQLCYRVTAENIAAVAADLLVNYAGIDPAFIDVSDWTDEAERWLTSISLTTIIPKPTGVTTLLGELSEFGVIWWWDDENQQIRMRANRPLDVGETAPAINDTGTIIEKASKVTMLDEQRLSRVFFSHGVLDYSVEPKTGNFARVFVPIDGSAEGPQEYDQQQGYQVFTRWLGNSGDGSVARAVSTRILNRYRNTPTQITFEYDVKDVGSVVVASPVTIQSSLIVDDTGNVLPSDMQITSVEEKIAGHRLTATAQSYQFSGRNGFFTENSRPDYDLSTDEQKQQGTYFVDEGTLVFSDGTPPYQFF